MSYFSQTTATITDIMMSMRRALMTLVNPPWLVKTDQSLRISGTTIATVTTVATVTGITNIGSISAATLVNDTNKVRIATALRARIT